MLNPFEAPRLIDQDQTKQSVASPTVTKTLPSKPSSSKQLSSKLSPSVDSLHRPSPKESRSRPNRLWPRRCPNPRLLKKTIHLPQPQPQPYIDAPRDDQVRTLFIAGFPDDVKAREIYNLFREFPGYESSHLRTSGKNSEPFAFAVFLNQQSAVAAMHALNGMVFDLEKKCTLYIDLAKSNSRSKRPRDDERQGFDKIAKVSIRYSSTTHGSGIGSTHLPGIHNSAYSTIGYPTAQSYVVFEDRGINESATAMMSTSSAPPCPTLFVANLGPRCTENELFQVFSRCPGFQKVKVQVKHGGLVAFVDFKDTTCSTGAMNLLQGAILHSSPAGEGIRLEYARSRMGMRGKGK